MAQTFTQLISLAKQKIKQTQSLTGKRNFLNQNYQQHEYLNIEPALEMFFKGLDFLANKGTVNPQIFKKFLQAPNKNSTTLLTLCETIFEVLLEEKQIRICHQHYSSQVVLLAFFLRYCYNYQSDNKTITIYTTRKNLKNWQKYFIDEKELDPQSALKALLKKQKINVKIISQAINQYKKTEKEMEIISSNNKDTIKEQESKAQFKEKSNEQMKEQGNQCGTVIFDLMNAQFPEYYPLLLLKRDIFTNKKIENIIVYHSNHQDAQIDKTLRRLLIEIYPVQASLCFPIEIQYTQKDTDIKKHLIDFLKEDSMHPQKQDIIIFYKNDHLSNSTAKRLKNKLHQLFSEEQLLPHIQFVLQKNQILEIGKNHIFIVQNVGQLLNWNYSYNEVFYVVDFGWDISFKMDHENYCYVEGLDRQDAIEKTKRMTFVGLHKVGKYIYKEEKISETTIQYDRTRQLLSYTLKMISLGFCSSLNKQNKRINFCLQLLKINNIIEKQQNGDFKVNDEEILKLNERGIDPIQAKIIKNYTQNEKDQQHKKVILNLLLFSFAIFNTRGNLRQSKDVIASKSVIKPSGIWRRTGYLHSCLEILTKAELIDAGKNAQSRSFSKRKTKPNEEENDVFGNLFEIIMPKKIQFEDMKMQDLTRQYYVNNQVFTEIREQVDEMRAIFNIEPTNIKIDQSAHKLIDEVIQKISFFVQNTIAVYSGSRRAGYFVNNVLSKVGIIFPNKDSLISQLNEFPSFLVIFRCSQIEGKKQILQCNNVSVEAYLGIFGQLPKKNNKSQAQHESEFHGVSSAVFKGLFKNNSFEMKKFEEENKCRVQTNEELATITICCEKGNQIEIKKKFDDLLWKIKQRLVNDNKIIHYLGNTNLSLSNGGLIKEVIKNNYINRCYLNNLDLEVTQQDLEQLFDEFFVLKEIQVLPVEPNKFSKSAIITFNSQKDYYRFYSYYNECKYMERLLDVKPIFMKSELLAVEAQKYILFKWFVWKSHKRAVVIYKKLQSAEKAEAALNQKPNFDAKPVKFSRQKNKIIFNDLHETIDEIYLQKGFSVYGEIAEVQILKTPNKQPTNLQSLLDVQIREALKIQKNIEIEDRYKIQKVQKLKNGLRQCKVLVKNDIDLKTLINSLNEVKRKNIGTGRLYAESWFTEPILVVYPSVLNLYTELLQQTIKQANIEAEQNNIQRPNIVFSRKDLGNNRIYILLKSPLSQTLNLIVQKFKLCLLPHNVPLTTFQKEMILTDIGIDNLIDIQQKYLCKLIVNTIKKQLQVMCLYKDKINILQQITARVQDQFFYRISLNNKSYKKLVNDKKKLSTIKQTYFLTILQIEDFSKTLIFQGSANHVQNALNYMMHLIQSFSVPQQQQINTQFCLICYTECNQPYRLQNCGHKFCFNCLDQYINSTLGDLSMFPIKCPHCMIELTIDDLDSLLDKNSWPKLINMALNQYVGKNAEVMTFCYTAGCKQVNMISLNHIKCDLCAQTHCCECKLKYHPGLTCKEAKQGTDQLFKKYMQENGVRICPNKNCKMPIVRTDGCYRVTCSRCNKSMCFKCDPDKMIAYDDYNDCYKHLNDAHGGYW